MEDLHQSKILVGDILKIKPSQILPADAILI